MNIVRRCRLERYAQSLFNDLESYLKQPLADLRAAWQQE
jgi:hypothetical protein